ncbi:MAG: hypothetical protein HYX96_01965 [Chloroflexi bacterium]|nr:hypothetical protein [Chloroflexota bacterium]
MKHLIRAGGVLFVIAFMMIIMRFLPVTESIEQFGFYRSGTAEADMIWATQEMQFADSSSCQSCHQDNYKSWEQGSHQPVTCESCHGPGRDHIAGLASSLTAKPAPEQCAVCHQQLASRPREFPQVEIESHAGSTGCVACHNPHTPAQPAAASVSQTAAIPHSTEGRADCLACHGAAGFKPYPEDHAGRANETCLSCHKTG